MGLAAICCLFEGTMYLFVFFWSAALKSARLFAGFDSPPSFGLAFASFMAAMMLGSQLFSISETAPSLPRSVNNLGLYLILASAALLSVVYFRTEVPVMWCLCAYEACIGLYFPSMGYLRSQLVPGEARGKVYSWLRLPLNTFVVITLSLHSEGKLQALRLTSSNCV
jgi:MFS transporter, MFS domain-containing protein family, molybdate-anion transporter